MKKLFIAAAAIVTLGAVMYSIPVQTEVPVWEAAYNAGRCAGIEHVLGESWTPRALWCKLH